MDPIEKVDLVDLEEFAKAGKAVPPAHHYKIRVDKEYFTVDVPEMKGRQILGLVHKTPEGFILSEKIRGGSPKVVPPDEEVSFTAPGIERFMTTPRDSTEGSRAAAVPAIRSR